MHNKIQKIFKKTSLKSQQKKNPIIKRNLSTPKREYNFKKAKRARN